MIQITLRLSASLLSILKDADNPKNETIFLQVEKGTTIKQILLKEKISPLLVPLISIDNKKQTVNTLVETDETITLIGPLAGG